MYRIYWEEGREYFECDCHDRDHLIRAVQDKAMNDNNEVVYEEISLRFLVKTGDYEYTRSQSNRFMNFFRRWRWRFKTAFHILFVGWFELEDEWCPERRGADMVRCKKELQKLIEWLAKKHIELEEREMKFRQYSPEELANYREFANKWGDHPIED